MEKIKFSKLVASLPTILSIIFMVILWSITGFNRALFYLLIILFLLGIYILIFIFADKLLEYGEDKLEEDKEILQLEKDHAVVIWAFANAIGISFLIYGMPNITENPLSAVIGLICLIVGSLLYNIFYYPRYDMLVRKRKIELMLKMSEQKIDKMKEKSFEVDKKQEYKKNRTNLAIGVAGGLISGGCLLAYQILLPFCGVIFSVIGALIVAFIIWKMAIKMIVRNLNNTEMEKIEIEPNPSHKEEPFDVWRYFLDLNPHIKQTLALAGLGLAVFSIGKTYNFYLYEYTLLAIFILGVMQLILGFRQLIIDTRAFNKYRKLKKR